MTFEPNKVQPQAPLRFHEWTTFNKLGNRQEPSRHILGARYDKDLDIAEIAKQIRRLIKEAVNAGFLPKIKTSVRIKRFAGGESLTIEVLECQEPIETQAVVDCVQTLERFIKSYQNYLCESMSDYWDTNFYGFVDWMANDQYCQWRKSQWEINAEVEPCPWSE